MKLNEFLEERVELYSNDIWERYGIQREKDGKQFVYSPFPSKEDYIESFQADIDDPYEELEDIEELDMEDIKRLDAAAIKEIESVYDKVAAIRHKFYVEHDMEELE